MKDVILTTSLLNALYACHKGIDFAVNNKLIGIDVSKLLSATGDNDFLYWFVDTMHDITDVVCDEKGRVIGLYEDHKSAGFEYDDKDRIVYEYRYPNREIKTVYDDLINVVTTSKYVKDKLREESIRKDGVLIHYDYYNSDGHITHHTRHTVNDDTTTVKYFDSDRILYKTRVYVNNVIRKQTELNDMILYNVHGNIIELYTNIDDCDNEYLSYEYDDQQRLIARRTMIDGVPVRSDVIEYIGNKTITKKLDGDRVYKTKTIELDDRGNVIVDKHETEYARSVKTISYEHDLNGVLVSITVSDRDSMNASKPSISVTEIQAK